MLNDVEALQLTHILGITKMKLGSNRKSMGMGADFREYSADNKRVRYKLPIQNKLDTIYS